MNFESNMGILIKLCLKYKCFTNITKNSIFKSKYLKFYHIVILKNVHKAFKKKSIIYNEKKGKKDNFNNLPVKKNNWNRNNLCKTKKCRYMAFLLIIIIYFN